VEAGTCKKDLVIEIPVDVVEREAEKITAQYRRLARLPGFRPGHAPASLVRTHFRKDIRSEVVQSLVPKAFEDAVKEQKLSVVGQPNFDDLKFDDHQPLTCKASFEILPDFELKEYKGLEVEEESSPVTDAEVNEALENLRQRAATLTVVEGEPAAGGDFLTVNYRGRNPADPAAKPVEVKEAVVHLGGQGTVPAFTENLKGAKVGEAREFEVAYPESYGEKTLAGKTLRYQVTVEGIKRRVLPPVDDELAKTASDFQTLDELRRHLREDLEKAGDLRAEMRTKEKLLEKLLETHSFPVPETLVEAQVQRKLERVVAELMAQGIDPRTVNVDWAKIREESRPEAEKETRAALLLERVAEAEKIEVSEEELDEAVRRRAEAAREPAAQLKTRLTRDGSLDKLKSSRRNQKALEFISRNSKIIRKNLQPAETPRDRTE
jgi:trigger factor